jgi:hypothetical protein
MNRISQFFKKFFGKKDEVRVATVPIVPMPKVKDSPLAKDTFISEAFRRRVQSKNNKSYQRRVIDKGLHVANPKHVTSPLKPIK